NRLGVLLAGLLLAISTNATPGIADTVKIVVPFAAGGPVDQLARVLAAELGPVLGDNVIVENRGGAGGGLGSEVVARGGPGGGRMTGVQSCWRAWDRRFLVLFSSHRRHTTPSRPLRR